jgi:hypothetical protein
MLTPGGGFAGFAQPRRDTGGIHGLDRGSVILLLHVGVAIRTKDININVGIL